MVNLKTILVPIDFSSNANNALRYAMKFAEATKSKLVIFHSNYIPSMFPSAEIKKIHEQSEGRKQMMLEYTVASICKKYKIKKPATISYVVKRETDVVNNILSAADACKAGLIIMGTHGATGLKKILMGSNASGVIEKSTIPVLAIPSRHKFKKIETVIYACDFKNISAEIKSLTPIAQVFDADIEILHLDYWNKGLDEKSLKILHEAINKSSYKKIKYVEKKAKINKTLQEHIESYTKKRKNSMLAMFPENLSFFEKIFFSSITKKISYNFRKPLLSIKKE